MMTGTIAQIVALTCYGNALLEGISIPGFFPTNSTCQFCDRVTFVEIEKRLLGKQKEIEIAKNPDEWFSYLKRRSARGMRLVHQAQNGPQISDRMSAGFVGGGGTWRIEVLMPRELSEFWQARWEVWNQKAPDRRIWRGTYGRGAEAKTKMSAGLDLKNTEEQLLKALRAIHAFSERRECGGFTNAFSRGISSLTRAERHGYHKDLSPPGFLPAGAVAILDASQSAWVFGGMGSWNDMGFGGADAKEYDRVSEQLFQTMTDAICVAASSGFKKAEPNCAADRSQPIRSETNSTSSAADACRWPGRGAGSAWRRSRRDIKRD
jgi:hypothetical protein